MKLDPHTVYRLRPNDFKGLLIYYRRETVACLLSVQNRATLDQGIFGVGVVEGHSEFLNIVVHTVILGIIRPPGVPLKVGGLCSLEVTQSQASSLVTEGENPSQAASRV